MKSAGKRLKDLLELDRRRGAARRALRFGPWTIALDGLDEDLARTLDRRWGGFVQNDTTSRPTVRVDVYVDERRLTLGKWNPGDRYELLGEIDSGRPLMRSYHVVMGPESDSPPVWRAAMTETDDESPERVLDNAIRYLTARLAVLDGGIALHGAGVVRDGRAHVFAGPSGSGKTTVVGLSAPSESLGDDFSVVLPGVRGWVTAAVPFDNREEAPTLPPAGLFPVAGIWRLRQASVTEVRRLPGAHAVAGLMSCVAFPWAMPDLADPILTHVQRFVAESTFADLYFRKTGEFWTLLSKDD